MARELSRLAYDGPDCVWIYEFDTSFGMGIVAPSRQQHTSAMCWLVLTVSESHVSNLLAIFAALPIEQARDFGA